MNYLPNTNRYSEMTYNRCGASGLMLPAVSLGLWHNFSDATLYDESREMARCAFDLGITHFDIANNYGPPAGSAEECFAKILKQDLLPFRDELIVSTKAGFGMWEGPYGDHGSRKYLIASIDQSLERLGLDYVDIFYHHRPDPDTPLEETMTALDHIVRQGKALYIGISNYYDPDYARRAYDILKSLGTPCLIHQVRSNMRDRRIENGLLDVQREAGVGVISFSPLDKGILTNRYLGGIPEDSRARRDGRFLKPEQLTDELLAQIKQLNELAQARGQTLAQMALAWALKYQEVTSVLIGASKSSQIVDCADSLKNLDFSSEELEKIDSILGL